VELFIFVRFHAREGEENALRRRCERCWRLRARSGMRGFDVFRSVRDRRLFYIHSRWTMKRRSRNMRSCDIPCDSSNAWMHCSISHAKLRGRRGLREIMRNGKSAEPSTKIRS